MVTRKKIDYSRTWVAMVFLGLTLSPANTHAVDWWAASYSAWAHPLLGTAMCGSKGTSTCRNKPFRNEIFVYASSQSYGWARLYALWDWQLQQGSDLVFTALTTQEAAVRSAQYIEFKTASYHSTRVGQASRTYRSKSYTHGHYKCAITMYENKMNNYNQTQRTAAYVHELGHCLGLDHYPSSQEIMYKDIVCTSAGTGPCGVTYKVGLAVHDGYAIRPYGVMWWGFDDPNWVSSVDNANGGNYAGQCIPSPLGYLCLPN